MRVVFISDTHGEEGLVTIPEGDLLIHAGDITNWGEIYLLEKFDRWVGEMTFAKTIVVPGNHDVNVADTEETRDRLSNCYLLVDSSVKFGGYKIYGSPWTPGFTGYGAYHRSRGVDIKEVRDKIPSDVDILVTHGPPFGMLDYVAGAKDPQGCEELLKVVERVQPEIHAFGHLHAGWGMCTNGKTTFINASVCTEGYKPTNRPIVIDM